MPNQNVPKKTSIVSSPPLKMPEYKYQETERGSYIMKPLVKKIADEKKKMELPSSLINLNFC